MQEITTELQNLERMGYNRIPKNVEEAVVSYKLLRVGEFPKMKSIKLNPQTEQEFQQYCQIFQQNSGNRQQVQRALSHNF